MKKMFYFLVALISCVLVFNSCEKNNSKECHILDGYTYQSDDGMMTYAFSDGNANGHWTMNFLHLYKLIHIRSRVLNCILG